MLAKQQLFHESCQHLTMDGEGEEGGKIQFVDLWRLLLLALPKVKMEKNGWVCLHTILSKVVYYFYRIYLLIECCCMVSTRAVGCALQIILEKWKKMLSVFAYPVVKLVIA